MAASRPPSPTDPGERAAAPSKRFPFLFAPDAAGTDEGDWGDLAADGGPFHRLLVLLGAIAQSHLIHERVIDEHVSQAYRAALTEPSVAHAARWLETLIVGRKVRAADLLGIVPSESSRAHAVASELRAVLQAVREGEMRGASRSSDRTERGARDEADDVAQDNAEAKSAGDRLPPLELLADLLGSHFAGRIACEAEGRHPRALTAVARPGPTPSDGPTGVLVRQDESRQPLHPFVACDVGTPAAPAVLWGLEEGRLVHRPLAGGEAIERESISEADFVLDFFLKMGAYEEVRDWLKRMSSDERAGLNRRNILYAGFCHYGLQYLRRTEYEQAAVELEKAVKLRPDLVLAHLHLAQCVMGMKQFDRAIEILKKHAVLYNRSDRIFELVGDCYRQKREAATALRMYERAAELNPWNAQVERKRELLKQDARSSREDSQKGPGQQGGAGGGQQGVDLDEFLIDMTLEAELGTYQNTVGREDEMRQLVEILACRDKRNPMVLGDPGVGKTALVEDFVLRIVQGRLPKRFADKRVYLMSVATLLAGAKFRGQFEERVLELVKLLKQRDAIVFIDNIHLIVSSGLTRGGAMDAANLLKPALLRGELQVIGATTHEEYRQNLEKDAQLQRAFQPLVLEEPSLEEAGDMICHVRGRYESHHRVLLSEELVRSTLPVIDRCVRERALPDKALDVFDRAAAVASLRRSARGGDERDVVELGRDDVLGVLAEVTRIPVARLHEDARSRFAHMEDLLGRRVIGQEEPIGRVSRVLRAARTSMTLDRRRPKGIFLFVGPTGVGKTELARAVAEVLFGSDERLVRIDMSEYMERINQSRLIGTAPGYVGYNDQNQLTDEVRKQPHSLVLLDEVEKADGSMLNLFLQVFDAGRLTDGKGRTVHFDDTTIVMTTNVGSHLYQRSSLGFEEDRGDGAVVSTSDLLREVKRQFTPEFLNRIDEVICFSPLGRADVRRIARQKLALFDTELAAEGKRLEVSDAAADILASSGYSADQGARNLERTIRRLLLEPLAERALQPGWDEAAVVRVDARDGELDFDFVAAGDGDEADSTVESAADAVADVPDELEKHD